MIFISEKVYESLLNEKEVKLCITKDEYMGIDIEGEDVIYIEAWECLDSVIDEDNTIPREKEELMRDGNKIPR